MTDIQELPLASTSPIIEALVTSKLFEAYLACLTKFNSSLEPLIE